MQGQRSRTEDIYLEKRATRTPCKDPQATKYM